MARKIIDKYDFSFFEMGQKLRNFSKLQEPGSAEVAALLEKGALVPNELVQAMLRHYQ